MLICAKSGSIYFKILNLISDLLLSYSTLIKCKKNFNLCQPYHINITDNGSQSFASSLRFKSFWLKKIVHGKISCTIQLPVFVLYFKNIIFKALNVLQILNVVKMT